MWITWLDSLKEYNANPSAYPDGYAMVDGLRYSLAATNLFDDMMETGFQQTHNLSVGGRHEERHRIVSLSVWSMRMECWPSHKDAAINVTMCLLISVRTYSHGLLRNWISNIRTRNENCRRLREDMESGEQPLPSRLISLPEQ